MTIEHQGQECLDFILQKISKSGDWRTAQALRFPGDKRNRRAAERLKELAASATEPNDVWQEIEGTLSFVE
jgi:hypothetical protein